MPDPLDRLFEQLRGQPPPAPFAPAEAVRRRGRQRTFHHAVAAGVAVLAVTGLGAGGVAAWRVPDPAPPPAAATPPAAPTQTAPTHTVRTAAGLLLTADDLAGSGWRHDPGELIEGPWYWDGSPWCPEYAIEDYPSLAQRIDLATTGWRRGAERVDQVVEVFASPGVAARNVDDVRAFVGRCSRRASPDGTVAGTGYEIEETGVAGQRSLLIRVQSYQFGVEERIEPSAAHDVVVVQVADAVTTIRLTGGAGDPYAVAERAATRLAE